MSIHGMSKGNEGIKSVSIRPNVGRVGGVEGDKFSARASASFSSTTHFLFSYQNRLGRQPMTGAGWCLNTMPDYYMSVLASFKKTSCTIDDDRSCAPLQGQDQERHVFRSSQLLLYESHEDLGKTDVWNVKMNETLDVCGGERRG
jgi:hypothetical protein